MYVPLSLRMAATCRGFKRKSRRLLSKFLSSEFYALQASASATAAFPLLCSGTTLRNILFFPAGSRPFFRLKTEKEDTQKFLSRACVVVGSNLPL
ncbi:hypothetical protein CEXT_318701 [Caerostris extrusa]|uniref:Uncharacterized protein n=1 Tax=Caerostris extrusa TaxID=172846 RepID=A0AAV4TVH7_CAEEX|nr:hypothetical protein CEXT_318701 [Caerostris extrusa]